MKKNIFILILLSSFSLYSQTINISPKLSEVKRYVPDAFNRAQILVKDNTTISFIGYNKVFNTCQSHHKFDTGILNGFMFFDWTKHQKESGIHEDFLLEGKNILIYETVIDINNSKLDKKQFYTANFNSLQEYIQNRENAKHDCVSDVPCKFYFMDDGVINIHASSNLKENKTEYLPANLKNRIYFYKDVEDAMYYCYDSITPPWVEGVEGPGIGEYLECEFKFKTDEIQILNGFVDFRRPALYKQNNRVKTILIESEEPKFSQEYTLEDVVKYNVLKLPARTDKIKITIKDVYKGTLYDDTCLSSIIADDPDYNMEADFTQLKKELTLSEKHLSFGDFNDLIRLFGTSDEN